MDAGLIQNALFSVKKGGTIRGYFSTIDLKKLENLLPKTDISTLPTLVENGNELSWKEEEDNEQAT